MKESILKIKGELNQLRKTLGAAERALKTQLDLLGKSLEKIPDSAAQTDDWLKEFLENYRYIKKGIPYHERLRYPDINRTYEEFVRNSNVINDQAHASRIYEDFLKFCDTKGWQRLSQKVLGRELSKILGKKKIKGLIYYFGFRELDNEVDEGMIDSY